VVDFATVSKTHPFKLEGPYNVHTGYVPADGLWQLAPENAGQVGIRKIEAIQDVISGW